MPPNIDTLIVIPARYHSSRFPGKPLAPILGIPMLQRVWDLAQAVTRSVSHVEAVVATEDDRIMSFCASRGIRAVLTSDHCQSGTERAKEVVVALDHPASFILNFQGDNALCPPEFLMALITAFRENKDEQRVITPFVRLNWQALDRFRQIKEQTPFSGTTVVFSQDYYAKWFSKQILPAIRNESHWREVGCNPGHEVATPAADAKEVRAAESMSPVCRHIGLYGYHREVLLNIDALRPTEYEQLEGLEQLAFLENDIPIKMVEVDYRGREGMSGIDSPEDIARAEAIIQAHGEILDQVKYEV